MFNPQSAPALDETDPPDEPWDEPALNAPPPAPADPIEPYRRPSPNVVAAVVHQSRPTCGIAVLLARVASVVPLVPIVAAAPVPRVRWKREVQRWRFIHNERLRIKRVWHATVRPHLGQRRHPPFDP